MSRRVTQAVPGTETSSPGAGAPHLLPSQQNRAQSCVLFLGMAGRQMGIIHMKSQLTGPAVLFHVRFRNEDTVRVGE